MSREDLFNEIICQECGHIAKLHGLAQCYGDEQKCKCSNKLGVLITVLEEDANWSGCELDDVKKERDALLAKLEIAKEAMKQFIERFDDESDTSMDSSVYVIEGIREALQKLDG